ncbi:hypothetical protein QFC20_002557 [Naganishia adeliensis]|uniref:Uncharacterized protein n=1 Tax=Naganishia adeliensis TaxID=92952 RepID=A0ACC2WKJ4_9TREE|nr:hypothetical protein QFC20_002557 [Naganishia adeliensis]
MATGTTDMRRTAVPLLAREVLDKVIQQGEELLQGSWEISTLLQARLELDDTDLTPFGLSKTFQLPDSLTKLPPHLINTALRVLHARPTAEEFPAGKGKVLCLDDAAGDPASLGIACLLYGLAEREDVRAERKLEEQVERVNGVGMLEAVELEASFLQEDARRAFKGLSSSNTKEQAKYLEAAYGQCKLYRQHLGRNDGLWKHIIMGPDKIDPWPWATSNGWVAAGILRVIATMRKADEAVQRGLQSEMADLEVWAKEIIEAASKHVDTNGMVREYIDEPDFEGESCGTALLAYSAYRLAQLDISQELIPFAERARQAVYNHIRPDGRLDKVCDIVDERKWRESSAEGQSFVVLLEAASRDYWRTVETRDESL